MLCFILYILPYLFHIRHCGIKNPSWAELRHFVKFLNIQLKSCEQSIFCDESLVGDVLRGLKSFVVKFMIQMSRVCSTRRNIFHLHNMICL